jgi:hypothetical protein
LPPIEPGRGDVPGHRQVGEGRQARRDRDHEDLGFVIRAIGHGGLDFEDENPAKLAEALTVLEAGLARWSEERGVEIG